eukprot:TRINITY_DN1237_c0_g1_i1.p1 TRINITY_DN1237_c0_g1~~TRINITY_DN1237_c0_g1_i1.p1  ORF type:complete len:375 (+),score=116.85 TRINITY_DN1237_c0_g1_i1:374-1498(+)
MAELLDPKKAAASSRSSAPRLLFQSSSAPLTAEADLHKMIAMLPDEVRHAIAMAVRDKDVLAIVAKLRDIQHVYEANNMEQRRETGAAFQRRRDKLMFAQIRTYSMLAKQNLTISSEAIRTFEDAMKNIERERAIVLGPFDIAAAREAYQLQHHQQQTLQRANIPTCCETDDRSVIEQQRRVLELILAYESGRITAADLEASGQQQPVDSALSLNIPVLAQQPAPVQQPLQQQFTLQQLLQLPTTQQMFQPSPTAPVYQQPLMPQPSYYNTQPSQQQPPPPLLPLPIPGTAQPYGNVASTTPQQHPQTAMPLLFGHGLQSQLQLQPTPLLPTPGAMTMPMGADDGQMALLAQLVNSGAVVDAGQLQSLLAAMGR